VVNILQEFLTNKKFFKNYERSTEFNKFRRRSYWTWKIWRGHERSMCGEG